MELLSNFSKMTDAPWWGWIIMVFLVGVLLLAKSLVDKLDINKVGEIWAKAHGDSMEKINVAIEAQRAVLDLVRHDQLISNQQRAEHSLLLSQMKADMEGYDDKLIALHTEMDELRKDIERLQQVKCENAPTCPQRVSSGNTSN